MENEIQPVPEEPKTLNKYKKSLRDLFQLIKVQPKYKLGLIFLIVIFLCVGLFIASLKILGSNQQIDKIKSSNEGATDTQVIVTGQPTLTPMSVIYTPIPTLSQAISKNPTLTKTPAAPAATNTPTPVPASWSLGMDQAISRCIPVTEGSGACDAGKFSVNADSGVSYVVYNLSNGSCAKFDLPAGMVSIYSSYPDPHKLDVGPVTTSFSCTFNFYTTEGHNYLKSQGKTPSSL